jgi:hypothetical protein
MARLYHRGKLVATAVCVCTGGATTFLESLQQLGREGSNLDRSTIRTTHISSAGATNQVSARRIRMEPQNEAGSEKSAGVVRQRPGSSGRTGRPQHDDDGMFLDLVQVIVITDIIQIANILA